MFTEQTIDKSLQYFYSADLKFSSLFPFTQIQVVINNCDYLLFKRGVNDYWYEREVNKNFKIRYLIEILKTLNIYKIKKMQIKDNKIKLCLWAKVDYNTMELVELQQLTEYWNKER
ncbi:MAG: hypothetical protein WCO84_01010 [bacterium]